MDTTLRKHLTIKNGLVVLGLIALIFLGRSTVVHNTETERLHTENDSLKIELRDVIIERNRLDSVNGIWEYEVDSLKEDNEVKVIVTKRKKKKRYENAQKMSLDSAIVASNILLDSAINSQRRVTASESDSLD